MSKSKFEERKKRVAEIMGKMDKAVENHFTTPEQLKEYIAFMSKFYDYSPRNSSLIQSQFKGATAVGSFKFWEDKGYSVKKREKGIQILVPNKVAPKFKDKEGKWKNLKYASKEEKEQIEKGQLEKKEGKMYFNVSHVFDISQTNAKVSDLPEIFPNRWLEGEVHGYNTIMSSLYDIAEEMEVSVGEPFGELGSAKGAFYHSVDANNNGHIGLNPRNSELQNVKTMIHELAHAKLHHSNHENHTKLLDAEKEFQAEMVAYSVASYFGIDTSDYSLQYLYSWTKNKEIRDKATLLNEVKETSVKFISAIEEDLIKERNKRKEYERNHVSVEMDEGVYWYEMMARPIGVGCQPKGFVDFDDDKGHYGVVAYK